LRQRQQGRVRFVSERRHKSLYNQDPMSLPSDSILASSSTESAMNVKSILLVFTWYSSLFCAESQANADIKNLPCTQVKACRSHFAAGEKFFRVKQYKDALREFQDAYGEHPDPRLLLNIGRTESLLGQHAVALKYYDRCMQAMESDRTLDRELRERLTAYRVDAKLQVHAKPEASTSDRNRPFYKKWWFWAISGLAVASGVSVAVGLSIAQAEKIPPIILPAQPAPVALTIAF